MKVMHRILPFVLAFSCYLVMNQPAAVYAIGAPSDNQTADELFLDDTRYDEIKPKVNTVLYAESTQQNGGLPSVFAWMTVNSIDSKVFAPDTTWYLDIDVNLPGWLYIYERMPEQPDPNGEWIAYKWQIPESGIWRLGPFTANDNRTMGRYIYQIWFYGNGLWPLDQGNPARPLIIERTTDKPDQTLPPAAPKAPVQDDEQRQLSTINIIALILIIAAAGILTALCIKLLKAKEYGTIKEDTIVGVVTVPDLVCSRVSPPAATLRIETIECAADIAIGENVIIGRRDIARFLDPDKLSCISKEHIQITLKDDAFYIEDLRSVNGTKLNGEDIRGLGRIILDDKSIIDIADTVKLLFMSHSLRKTI